MEKVTGTMKISTNVAPNMPPMTTVPSTWRETPPEPVANQRGRQPQIKAKEVMRMGRSRMRAPVRAASETDLPFSYSVLAKEMMRMAFLAARPMSMMRPI